MSKAKNLEARVEKHRKTHKLLQTWVSPELWKAIHTLAKNEGRTPANYMRRELGKLAGLTE